MAKRKVDPDRTDNLIDLISFNLADFTSTRDVRARQIRLNRGLRVLHRRQIV